MSEIIYAYRLCPCPAYDVEGMESWLSDMSAAGLHLSRDGFFGGLAILERGEPRRHIYRLNAAPPRKGDDDGTPAPEALHLSEAMGWQYVTRCGDFHIYRSSVDGARELNTDPDVQAMALKQLEKRWRSALGWMLFEAVFLFFLWVQGRIVLAIASLGVGYSLFALGLILWDVMRSVRRCIHLRRLRKRLRIDGCIDHKKDWRRRARLYQASRILWICGVLLAVILGLCKWNDAMLDTDHVPLDDFDGEVPFLTIADIFPEGEYTRIQQLLPSEMRQWSTAITPVNIAWMEYASIHMPKRQKADIWLEIQYHETISPFLARRIAEEYRISAKMDDSPFDEEQDYRVLDIPLEGVDYAHAYFGAILHNPVLILQNGNQVMRIQFYQYTNKLLTVEAWMELFTAALRDT